MISMIRGLFPLKFILNRRKAKILMKMYLSTGGKNKRPKRILFSLKRLIAYIHWKMSLDSFSTQYVILIGMFILISFFDINILLLMNVRNEISFFSEETLC